MRSTPRWPPPSRSRSPCPKRGNLGGGGFAITYDPRRRQSRALDFRERAPHRTHENTYVDLAREGITDASTRGPLAAGIPGSPAGLHALWEAEGSLPWERLVRPAFELAVEGFVIGEATARRLETERKVLESHRSTRAIFFPRERTLREGERLVQPALAEVLLTLMREGPVPFYRGAIARRLVADVERAGGLWTLDDLASYRVQWRRPVHWPLSTDGRVELITMGAPSSAGTLLPQVWTLMQAQGAARFAPDSADRAHAWIESFRLAFADRNAHLGDPAWMRIDERALVESSYLRTRARLLPPHGVAGSSAEVQAGDPVPARGRRSRRDHDETTHLVVIDGQGRAVSLTTTLNGNFGSGWISPSTGILLNNQMDDFDTRPGVPNLYGLVGGDQNRVRPGARMLSSMSPAIVTRDGRTWLALGGRGGPRIATAVAQILYARTVDGWPLDRAVAAPRLHHQWIPDEARLEVGRSWPGLEESLGTMGHTVSPWTRSGAVHAAEMLDDGLFVGVADPRERGLARCVDPETDDTRGDRNRLSPRPVRRGP
jgi:gamma-glutamyltranspeptidase / glutathione hydrolase